MNSQKRNNLLVAGPILCNFVTRRLFVIKKGFAAVELQRGRNFVSLSVKIQTTITSTYVITSWFL